MKIPQPFKICDFAIRRKSAQLASPTAINSPGAVAPAVCNRKSAIVNRKSQNGIALVITLIMLAITLVMAVAFLALAKRERTAVNTITDNTIARHAADSGVAHATAQIVANMFGGLTNGFSSNTYNLHLLVSTNYINPVGFLPGIGNPTNVNYTYLDAAGNPLMNNIGLPNGPIYWMQNISNLWFLPRAPVFVPSNSPVTGYDFRYYLDLNENGKYDTNYFGQDIDNETPPQPFGLPYLHTGDPEWIGVLEHPDAPHGPNNHFISRYAFIAVPVGNTLDINYVHNQARNTTQITANDAYMRNQGVGTWEINLAAFLADLNTNVWGQVGLGLNSTYAYNEPGAYNTGRAFDDARALLAYRYNNNLLARADIIFPFARANQYFQFGNTFDAYSDGALQTTLDFNANLAVSDRAANPWSGADNTNHFFTPSDFFDLTKTTVGVSPLSVSAGNDFTARLQGTGGSNDTYNAYTFYRMLDQLGTDSLPEDGRLNLNYSNAVVTYTRINNTYVVSGVNVVPGAETNLVPWKPQDFFLAAADRLLRAYSTNWYQLNPTNYLINYYNIVPQSPLYVNGQGSTNYPSLGLYANQIPSFGITNIPVLVNGKFVYSPSVNRLLQLAANIYDAANRTNNPPYFDPPHVFRPIFENDGLGNIFIVGYTNVISVSGTADLQLLPPHLLTDFTNPSVVAPYQPFNEQNTGSINFYGVPWIIGAKKGLPNFNQLNMITSAQVSRKLQITRNLLNPKTATYSTNQMYIMGISNSVGVSFWNSYSNYYGYPGNPRQLAVYVSDYVAMGLTNGPPYNKVWVPSVYNFVANVTVPKWFGSQWAGTLPNTTPAPISFFTTNWSFTYLSPLSFDFTSGNFDTPVSLWHATTPPLPQLPQFGLLVTNYLQAFILDGNNVIDYVQLRDPVTVSGVNQALADPDYPQPAPKNGFLQWSTNTPSSTLTPYGVINQLYISGHPPTSGGGPTPLNLMPPGGQWSTAATPMGQTTPEAEAAFFNGFFVPSFIYSDGKTYINNQLSVQAPYTPSRMIYSSFLMQANDPLVHYMSSDLNAQVGTTAIWANGLTEQNGLWYHSDDPALNPTPQVPGNPIGGRYQPWLRKGQMSTLSALTVVPVTNNYGCIDPMAYGSDWWDFPTNAYPTVGWIGRVHRGTPWQTVYLKDFDLIRAYTVAGKTTNYVGAGTWATWTGDIQTNLGGYYDALNTAPVQDRLLFDIFTTRLNDNAARGTLPVNAGAGQPEGGIAAWSALFSGMVALTNNLPFAFSTTPLSYTYYTINPVGQNWSNSPLWQIVNNPTNGINATRANTALFPYQSFAHAGDILATPQLSGQSPYLNQGTTKNGNQQYNYAINDEMYEWLPQQMMGLVRRGESRYVLYCFGQTLHPAPNGTVLSGSYFQMVTNYQVTAQTAVRAVIRVDNANTPTPHAVVESYNVLPPN